MIGIGLAMHLWPPFLCGAVRSPSSVDSHPLRQRSQYGLDFWREAEGLPQSRIRAIVQTRDGYLWLGTDGGVVRFDGANFTAFTVQTGTLKDNEISGLQEDRDGGLWIGTFGGGVTVFRKGRFTTYTTADGLPDDYIWSLDIDPQGHLWLATASGICRYANGSFTRFGRAQGLPAGNVSAFCARSPFGILVAFDSRVYRLAGGRFAPFRSVEGDGKDNLQQMLYAADGALWLRYGNALVKRWKNGRMTTYRLDPSHRSSEISHLAEGPPGTIWLGHGRQLLWLKDEQFVPVPIDDPAHDLGVVYSLCHDREGSIWLGLRSNGLVRLRIKPLHTLSAVDGLPSESIRSVYQDPRSDVWIGLNPGFARYHDGKITSHLRFGNRTLGSVRSFAQGPDGRLWLGAGDDLFILDHDCLIAHPYWKAQSPVMVIHRDRQNRMWVGTDGAGLFLLDGRRFLNLRTADGLAHDRIRALCSDRHGVLWIGTFGGGVSRYEQGKFTTCHTSDGLDLKRITAIHEDEEGSVWIASRGGLTRWRDGSFFTFTSRSGLPVDHLYNILEDGLGNFWFGSAQGLLRVRAVDLRDFAAGRLRQIMSVGYGVRDGMKTRACSVVGQPTAWRTADGLLLFGSMQGLVVAEPRRVSSSTFIPPVYVEKVLLNRQEQKLDRESRVPLGGGEAEIHYAALSFLAPEKLRFKYRMEGFDKDWVDAGGRRFAYYANLPPGRYQFRVIAGDVDGAWNETGAAFTFYFNPRFYQTWVFLIAVAVSVILLTGLFYRLRMHGLRARYSMVLEERNRIAQDIHDTFAQNLAGIALQLDSMTMQLADVPAHLRESLDQACNLTRYSLAEARRAIGDLRSDELERRQLADAVPEIANRLAAGTAVRTEIRIVGSPRNLNPLLEKNLLRILREAVANALKHAQARVIDIELRYEAESLMLHVRDDGKGFDTERAIPLGVGHYGLIGMRERVERIGGHLKLSSRPGEGTDVLVDVPFSA
jgi:signal transduction histidine kinase/ligand-binding sensor domain-containing protein